MAQTRWILAAPLVLLTVWMAGCGGGDSTTPTVTTRVSASDNPSLVPAVAARVRPFAATTSSTAAPTTVQLEGCVVTTQWSGVPGAAVHVRTAQGRVVATVLTNSRGVFVAMVPARTDIVVDTEFAGRGGLALRTGSSSLSAAGCLIAGI